MANHLRRQIRERIVTDVTGLSTTGSNVFESRVYPIEESKLPCILVYDADEELTIDSSGSPREIASDLTVTIEGYAQGGSGKTVMRTLNAIQKEIQIALSGDIRVNNLARDSYLVSADASMNAEATKPTGTVRLSYLVIYQFKEDRPDVAV
jgi:hypothetical protein